MVGGGAVCVGVGDSDWQAANNSKLIISKIKGIFFVIIQSISYISSCVVAIELTALLIAIVINNRALSNDIIPYQVAIRSK
jgi:hypothetical protein